MGALGRLASRWLRQRQPTRRATAWVLAVAGPLLIGLGSLPIRSSFGLAGVLFCSLLVVVAVALIGGVRPALLAVVIGVLVGAAVFARPLGGHRVFHPGDGVALAAFVVVGAALGVLIDELAVYAEERGALLSVEAALRRLATLVARAAPRQEVFAAATEEAGRLLGVDHSHLGRYEPDGTVTIVAVWSRTGDLFPVGGRWSLGGRNLATSVFETGRPARIDSYADASGPRGVATREGGMASGVGTPVIVEGHLWGVMATHSTVEQPLPAHTEARLASFTELLATAIANAESRADLAASRARIVAAGDDARRRIERDLHDGAQQRLVTLGLELRAAQAAVPPELGELKGELSHVAEALTGVLDELREIARGLHPAILAEGGLAPALKALARRSPIPVECEVRAQAQLPERVEAAAYYVVSEALTNAAKHAHASVVHVDVEEFDHLLRLCVRDDGAGGADPIRGSGLVGLKDRVEALGGTIAVESPPGAGTAVYAELPLDD
jgi:signal transduction histidine kinase